MQTFSCQVQDRHPRWSSSRRQRGYRPLAGPLNLAERSTTLPDIIPSTSDASILPSASSSPLTHPPLISSHLLHPCGAPLPRLIAAVHDFQKPSSSGIRKSPLLPPIFRSLSLAQGHRSFTSRLFLAREWLHLRRDTGYFARETGIRVEERVLRAASRDKDGVLPGFDS